MLSQRRSSLGRGYEVAAFAANPDNAPGWYEHIKSADWRTRPSLAAGSRVAFVAHFLGRQPAYTYEVVAHEPRERLVMRTGRGPIPDGNDLHVDTVDGGTRMTLRNSGTPAGFSRLFAPFVAMAATAATLARRPAGSRWSGGDVCWSA